MCRSVSRATELIKYLCFSYPLSWGAQTLVTPLPWGACASLINTGTPRGAVNCYEPDQNERIEMMLDRAVASMHPVETVPHPGTVLKPYGSVTTSRVALKNLDVELCPETNPAYDIHDRVGFVHTNYTTNNRTNTLKNLDANSSGICQISPVVSGYPELNPNLSGIYQI